MKQVLLLLFLLMSSFPAYAQGDLNFRVRRKALDVGVYDPQKEAKKNYCVFYDEEAEREFMKVLLKDEELKKRFELTINEQGDPVLAEVEVCEYYPEADVIVITGGHGYVSTYNIRTKRENYGEPTTYACSPSGKYRLSGWMNDGMVYYLSEKIDGEYVGLGRVYFDVPVSGYYWVDDETIYFLRERIATDGSLYWMAYSGWFEPFRFTY